MTGIIMQDVARITCLIALGLAVAAQQRAAVPKQFLISQGRAGQFEVGQLVDEVYQAIGKENTRLVDVFAEGLFTPALEIRLPSPPVSRSIVAVIREFPCPGFAIWSIEVLDPRFRTAEGLGVGSTVADLRGAYEVEIVHEEGEKVRVPSLKVAFATDWDASNDASVVAAVIVTESPETTRARRCPGR